MLWLTNERVGVRFIDTFPFQAQEGGDSHPYTKLVVLKCLDTAVQYVLPKRFPLLSLGLPDAEMSFSAA